MGTGPDKVSQTRRLDAIRVELAGADEVSIDRLAHKFGVSAMTIRRDLELLESRGEVIRTHGGAALAKRLTFEFAFRDRQNKDLVLKRRIAAAAVQLINDGSVVMLDTGTTTLQIAESLIGKRSVTVVTTSLAIVSRLQFAADIRLILLGGFLHGSPDLHGPLTEQNVESFHTDIAFLGADAIDLRGNTYTDDLQIVNLDRKMAANARRVVITADSSKLARSAMCRVFAPADYDLILTDSQIDRKIVKEFSNHKIKLQLA